MKVATAVRRWIRDGERGADPTVHVILAAAIQLDALSKNPSPETARAAPALARLIRQLIVAVNGGAPAEVVDQRIREIEELM